MSELEIKYVLTLDCFEGKALKKLLGNMTDSQFAAYGVEGDDRERLREIYNLIPQLETEEE